MADQKKVLLRAFQSFFVTFLVLILFLQSCAVSNLSKPPFRIEYTPPNSTSASHLTTPSQTTRATTKDWTIMVYMAGDNSLGAVAVKDMVDADIKEMQAGGGTNSDINIIVLVDKYLGGWYNSHCYLVYSNRLTEISLSSMGYSDRELNMGLATTLSTFVLYSMQYYPAQKYMLILWDHGSGWSQCCTDDTNGDELTPTEIESALNTVKSRYGRINILGFDACYMASFEMMYQLKNVANIQVSSEYKEAFAGWDYESSISWLISNPTSTPEQLATRIVTDYDNYYSNYYTLSAINLSKLDVSMSDTLNLLLQSLKHRSGTYTTALSATSQFTLYYRAKYGGVKLCDLFDFADNVNAQVTTNSTIDSYCVSLKSKINDSVIYEKHSTELSDSHGISFYFPQSSAYFDYSFFRLKWHTDSCHYDFLKNYWYHKNKIATIPAKPTITTVGTTCYVNGSGTQVKVDRGDWLSGHVSISTASHTIYTRAIADDEYSLINSTTISGVDLIITTTGAGAFSIALEEDWNMISAPATAGYTAKTWCMDIGAKEIIRKNPSTGAYDEYVYDFSPDSKDFVIQTGSGYFVYVENETTYIYSGLSEQAVLLALGWNIVGVSRDILASSILAKSDSIKNIAIKKTDGTWQAYNSQLSIGDFTINRGWACYVFTSNPTTIRI